MEVVFVSGCGLQTETTQTILENDTARQDGDDSRKIDQLIVQCEGLLISTKLQLSEMFILIVQRKCRKPKNLCLEKCSAACVNFSEWQQHASPPRFDEL